MIQINNKLSIQQVMKVTDNQTGEIDYLIVDEDNKKWKKLTEEEYNQIRGNSDG